MADGRLYDVARAQRALLLSNDRAAASEMVRVYGGIWTRIRRELEMLLQEKIDAEAAGEVVGQSWLYQFDRLEKLQRQVLAEMRRFAQYCEGVITQQQQAAIDAARLDTERQIRAIANQAGVSINWVQLPNDVVEDLVGFTANGSPLRDLLEELGKDAMKGIRDALIEGIALGKNPTEVARQARAAFGGDLTRALRIARTEMLRSYREATRRSYEANEETVSGWVWNCACTPRSCAICWALHGTVHQVSEVFGTHPNCRCFPAGTLVSGPAPVAASMRYYTGELVTIRTASGIELSFTPNHPILTRRGWVSGGLLQEGDDVIRSAGCQNTESSADVDYQNVPTRIEDVVKAFDVVLGEMPTTAEDFHGDGMGSQVHVVFSNGLLRDDGDAAFGKPLCKQYFSLRNVGRSKFSRLCTLDKFVFGTFDSSYGSMGILGASDVFFGRSQCGAQLVRGCLSAQFDFCMFQPYGNDRTRGIVEFSETVDGLPCQVASADFVNTERVISHASFTDIATADKLPLFFVSQKSSGFEFSDQWTSGETEQFASLLGIEAGEISFDRVVHVSRRDFAGHVYNLQTNAGWYIGNGIITHNCSMLPIVKPVSGMSEQYMPTSGPEQFSKLEPSVQDAILGKQAGQAYREGKIKLEDVWKPTFSKDWGPSKKLRTLKELLG